MKQKKLGESFDAEEKEEERETDNSAARKSKKRKSRVEYEAKGDEEEGGSDKLDKQKVDGEESAKDRKSKKRKMTLKEDTAYDKKHGIKEHSKEDEVIDKLHGVKDRGMACRKESHKGLTKEEHRKLHRSESESKDWEEDMPKRVKRSEHTHSSGHHSTSSHHEGDGHHVELHFHRKAKRAGEKEVALGEKPIKGHAPSFNSPTGYRKMAARINAKGIPQSQPNQRGLKGALAEYERQKRHGR